MRKSLLIIFLLFNIINSVSIAQEKWTKLRKNIFINYKTVVTGNGSKNGWFKIIEPQQQTYKLEKYKAYCKQNVIEVQHTKIFNFNNILLKEEINNTKVGCNYSGITNGKIYFNALCKNKFLRF